MDENGMKIGRKLRGIQNAGECAVLLAALILASCGKAAKDGGAAAPNAETPGAATPRAETPPAEAEQPAPKPRLAPARLIGHQTDVALFRETENGEMRIEPGVACKGDAVSLLLDEGGEAVWKSAILRLDYENKPRRDFAQIVHDGAERWVLAANVSGPNFRESLLVTEDAAAYSAPDEDSATGRVVGAGTFVAAAGGGEFAGFRRCAMYDTVPFGREVFLKEESLSANEEMKEISLVLPEVGRWHYRNVRDEILLELVRGVLQGDDAEEKAYLAKRLGELEESELSDAVREAAARLTEQNADRTDK